MRITDKKLNILGITAIILIIFTVMLYMPKKDNEIKLLEGSYLMGGLSPEDVSNIVISKGNHHITLSRNNKGFSIIEKNGYSADPKKINELFTKCLDIQVGGIITNNKSNYKDLGVDKNDKDSVLIEFKDKNNKLISGIIIGKESENGRGKYIRQSNKKEVYVSKMLLDFNSKATYYLDKTLFNIKSKDISKISVVNDKEKYTIARNASGEVKLLNPPKDKKLNKGNINSVFNALVSLGFDDVASEVQKNLKFINKFICIMKNNITYQVDIAKNGSDTWIKLSSTGPSSIDIENSRRISKNDSEKELKNKSSVLDAGEIAKKFNAKTAGWVYKIPTWKAENLTKKMNDFIAKDKKKKSK